MQGDDHGDDPDRRREQELPLDVDVDQRHEANRGQHDGASSPRSVLRLRSQLSSLVLGLVERRGHRLPARAPGVGVLAGSGRASRSARRSRRRAARRRRTGPASRSRQPVGGGSLVADREREVELLVPGGRRARLVVAAVDEVEQRREDRVGAVAALVGEPVGERGVGVVGGLRDVCGASVGCSRASQLSSASSRVNAATRARAAPRCPRPSA